jgi:hypothetical protein
MDRWKMMTENLESKNGFSGVHLVCVSDRLLPAKLATVLTLKIEEDKTAERLLNNDLIHFPCTAHLTSNPNAAELIDVANYDFTFELMTNTGDSDIFKAGCIFEWTGSFGGPTPRLVVAKGSLNPAGPIRLAPKKVINREAFQSGSMYSDAAPEPNRDAGSLEQIEEVIK